MSSTLRSVNTHFWNDRYTRKLSKDEKLLYLYFITNPLTNIAGIYEITLDRISFDTGVPEKIVSKALESFERDNKIIYYNDYLIIINFLKNQKLNPNMKIGALNIINELPNDISSFIFNGLGKPFESFQMVLKTLLKVKGKIERESEIESEIESEASNETKIDFNIFWNAYDKKVGSKEKIQKKWNKLSIETQKEILKHIEAYKKAQPNKQYRKNAETYLNNESWNDEIIIYNKPKEDEHIEHV